MTLTKKQRGQPATKGDVADAVDELGQVTAKHFAVIEETMATKDDITNMATKDDIANMATKDDIVNMATKDDLTDMKKEIISSIRENIGDLQDRVAALEYQQRT